MYAARFLISALAVLLLASTAHADRVLATGTVDGVFVRLDQGDYMHFVIKDARGKEQDFFVTKGDSTVDAFLKSPERYKGRKVRVKWQEVMSVVPEAGGQMRLREVVSVRLR